MGKGNRTVPMEMGMELQSASSSKIQVLDHQVPENQTDRAQRNLDEICQLENVATFDAVLPAFLHDGDRRYTKQDLQYNFFVLYATAWIKMSPFGVDKSSKNYPRLRVGHQKLWKNIICIGWFLLAWIRALGCTFATVHFMLTQDTEKELNRVTLMICISNMFTLLMYMSSRSCLDTMQHAAPLFNSVCKYLDQEPEENTGHAKDRSRPWKFGFGIGFGGHTVKELMIIYEPFTISTMTLVTPLLSIVDPSFPILLVSLVPSEFQFSLPFFFLIFLDSLIFTYFLVVIHQIFHWFFQMHRIQEEAQLTTNNLIRKFKSFDSGENSDLVEGGIQMWNVVKSIRLLHIWTQFFNVSHSSTVYAGKLIALSGAVFGGFGVVKMIQFENWPYATLFGLFSVDGIFLYNLCFGDAYKIPEKVSELKQKIKHVSFEMKRKNRNRVLNSNAKSNLDEQKYIEKVLRSVPWLGVKDGVYKMDRMTCVNFLEFVVSQVTSLVLGY